MHSRTVSTLRESSTRVSFRARTLKTALGRGGSLLVVEPGATVGLRFDATRPESRLARAVAEQILEPHPVEPPASVSRATDAPGDRYVDFLVPGLVGMNIMTVCLWGIGWNVVESRGQRRLRRLAVTPMRRSDYLASFLIAHAFLVVVTLALVMVFAAVAFDVRVVGSWVALTAVSCGGAAAFSALGVLAACRTEKVEVLSGIVNAISLVQIVGSGVFFSTSNFPDAIATGLRALPLTALVDALRAIALEGRGLLDLPIELGVLTVWTFVAGGLGLRLFRWT